LKEILHLLKIIKECAILMQEDDGHLHLLDDLKNICWSKLEREVELLKITEGAFKE